MEENPEALLIEIQEGLKRLEASLPRRVDGFAVSPLWLDEKSRIP
jgi:hypothetical protein